jgi:RNA polymerase sigma-70 factor (ECF subfamily)
MLRLVRGSRPPAAKVSNAPHDELAGLVAGVLRGEPEAARSFVIAIAGPVRRAVAMVLSSNDGEVDDATQEAILGALNALPRFRGECTATQFAVRIGVLSAMGLRRRRIARDRRVANDALDDADLVEAGSSPFEDVEAARRREAIRRLLDKLSPSIAEAVVLYFMLGYTVPEIAALMHAPVNTIWSRLRLGRERMRRALRADATLGAELGATSEEWR